MHGLHRTAFACTLTLCLSTPLSASTVFRCEDASGHITFTQQGCPVDQTQHLHDARNHTPSSGAIIPLASPAREALHTPRGSPNERTRALIVVGEREDGCGDLLTGSARREAMVKQQVRRGMTQADVESMFGKPQRTSSRNGESRWHYVDRTGNTRQVSFDEAGCVKG